MSLDMMNNPIIIKIKPTLSGRTVSISLSTGNIVRLPIDSLSAHHLGLGSPLCQELVSYAHLYQLREYALSCLARSGQTEKMLRQKLKMYSVKYHLSSDDIDTIIKDFLNRQLLDQASYVRDYQTRYPRKSYQRLKAELVARGIDQSTLGQILIQDPTQELTAAISLVKKKHPTPEKLRDPHQKSLILSSIIRNGFSYSVAKNAIDAYSNSL